MNLLVSKLTRRQLQAAAKPKSTTWLFVGPNQVGKFTAALTLAARLNCPDGKWDDNCLICRQITAENNPDLHVIRPEKTSIGIAQIHGLKSQLQLAAYHSSGWRIVIIDEAEKLTGEAQNSLLKILEESPLRTLFILVAAEPERLLPTVRSRCQKIIFTPPSRSQLVEYLDSTASLERGIAMEIAVLAGNRPGRALELLQQPDVRKQAEEWGALVQKLSQGQPFANLLAAATLAEQDSRIEEFLQALALNLRTETVDDPAEAKTYVLRLQAIQDCFLNLRAGVGTKLSLEALMLKLS